MKLTLANGDAVWIYPAAIQYWTQNGSGATVHFAYGRSLAIKEDPEAVTAAIAETAAKMASIAGIASYEATMRHAQNSGDL